MSRSRCVSLLLLALTCAQAQSAAAQTLITNVPTGTAPVALAVNPASNKIFAVNQGSNNLTVLDGLTNGTGTVKVGLSPSAVAVNTVTSRIYVANSGDNTVTVVDGNTYATATVPTGTTPMAVAVNPVTDRIYVANEYNNSVTVIDGNTSSVITTVPVGVHPQALAVNPITYKVYVANMSDGSVTVIDGLSNYPTRIYTGGSDPYALDFNSQTNRIYVANLGGTVSVIDGASETLIASVPVGPYPVAVAVNPVSNKIYVTNSGNATVSVIDGTTNAAAPVPVGGYPGSLAVDAATNKIYVADNNKLITIDGVSDSVAGSAFVGYFPDAVAVNPASNTIYVANNQSNNVSVVAGASSDPLQFIPVTPCRVADTRLPHGPFGGPTLSAGTSRDFAIPNSVCGIPSTASAYALNVTVVPHGFLGYISLWPTGQNQPYVSTLNSTDGRIKADAAIVPAGTGGAISVFASHTTDVVLDINGYFTRVTGSTLAFYPLNPCRVVDTRWPNGPLGGPFLQGGAAGRDFPVTTSSCNIPSTALAYSFNFTAVPIGPLSYLTTWPAGQSQPYVSTLNAVTGVTTANAAIVAAGTGGDIDVYVTNPSHVIIDVNGYFAPPAPGGLSLYTTVPCRLLDTRLTHGAFSGELNPPVNVVAAPCGMPGAAQAFVLNATVVPQGMLGFLALWPDGTLLPLVSTLNASDGTVTSNMAIVPTNNGSIDAYASNPAQLILDGSSYFGP